MSNTRSQRKKFRPKSNGRISWCILIFERLYENISLAPGFKPGDCGKKGEIHPFQRLFGAGEPLK